MRVEVVDPSRTRALRREVLRPGAPADLPSPGDERTDALHFAAIDDGPAATVIGACMVAPQPYPLRPARAGAWRLRGMATDPARRGRGIGSAVIARVLTELRARDAELLWCNARLPAIPFYAARGFATEGPVFVPNDLPIEHQRMWRPVAERSPDPTSSGRVDRSGDRSSGA